MKEHFTAQGVSAPALPAFFSLPRAVRSRPRKSLRLFSLALIPLMAGGFVFQQHESQRGARLLDQVLNIW